MENLTLYEIISFIVSIIVLIVFLVMAIHIETIKRVLVAERIEKRKKELGLNAEGKWICPKCHKENNEKRHYCQNCGFDLI